MADVTPTVFVVDDDISVRESLELLITSAGWRPEMFVSAQDFLSHPRSTVPCCLVLDVSLPGLDGLSLLRQMAEAGVLKTSKVVVVTTRSVEAEMIKAMELGAVDYITKPVSLPVLLRRLRSALAGASGVT